jgi:nickel transport protein
MAIRSKRAVIAALAVAGTVLAASAASGHGIWFSQRANQIAMIYGVGADDLDAVRRMDKLTSFAGYDENWQPVEAELRVAGPLPVVDSAEPVAAVTAAMNYGIWTKTPDDKWHNAGLDQHPDAVISERTMKYAVYLVKMPTTAVPLLPNQTLQVVPVSPIPELKDQPLTLRVYYEGKPVADASVLADYVNDPDQPPLKTDAAGEVTVPVRNQGQNTVVAYIVVPSSEPALYEKVEHRASLTFVLPHLPE